MFAAKDYWGAYSRGTVELAGLILSLIPESPSKYLEAYTGIKALVTFKREITVLSDLRLGLALLKQSGKVSAEGVKVAGELLKLGLKNGDEATKLLGSYLFNNDNLALLGNITKDVKTAEEVGGLEARQAALKKEFDGLMKMIKEKGGYNAAGEVIEFNGKVQQSKLPRTIEKSVEDGTLINPSYSKNQKYTVDELRLHEEANQHYGESSAHTFEKHIDVDDNTLIQRATNDNLKESSRYNNVTNYEKVVNETLNDPVRQKQIKEWLAEENTGNPDTDNLKLTYRTNDGKSLGKVLNREKYLQGKNEFTYTDKAVIILKKKPDGTGYFILTSFPVTKF